MRCHLLQLFFVFGCLAALTSASGESGATATLGRYDVVIAGAGTGGTAAAIEAARLGAHVALLEETDWIGGQAAAAGVSTMDEGQDLTPPSGIYREFIERMNAYYVARGKAVGTCYWHDSSHCYEPSAIRRILNEMINEVNANPRGKGRIDLLLEQRVARVLAHDLTVTGVVTQKGLTLQSKVLIDATEYGDVLPLAPGQYRSSYSIGADHPDTCTQDITYVMIIKKYPDGVPKELQMLHPPPEYEKWMPSLRASWQVDGNPKTRTLPVDFVVHNAYRGLPDSRNSTSYVSTEPELITRTALNWFNDYPVQTNIYDRTARKRILCQAKLKTLANLYYLQHELGETSWSVANDEGYDTAFNRTENACPNIPAEFKAIEDNMPPMPYIRESQRMVGEYTLTGADIRREKQGGTSIVGFPDSIAVGDYADDLHGCSQPDDFDHSIENLSNRPPGFRMGPFEVPLRALIPEKVDGLLAAEKNISQSRLANGATRLQPITMLTGQAAGALAALAVEQGVQPRAVAPDVVQRALLAGGSIVAREPMPALPMLTRSWQAAQFAAVHQWLDVSRIRLKQDETLTRSQVADLLTRAFGLSHLAGLDDPWTAQLGTPKEGRPTYGDVPLYSPTSAAVEAWHATGTLPPCKDSPTLFCPNAHLTTSEFLDTVESLYAQIYKGHKIGIRVLREGVGGTNSDPLTRINAVLILYNTGL